jgi:hypothetical protein
MAEMEHQTARDTKHFEEAHNGSPGTGRPLNDYSGETRPGELKYCGEHCSRLPVAAFAGRRA